MVSMRYLSPIALLLALCLSARAETDASRFVELTNGDSTLLVSVETGKVLSWSALGVDNLLWLAEPDALTNPNLEASRGDLGGSCVYPIQEKLMHFVWGKEWSAEDYESLDWKLVEQSATHAVVECESVPGLGVSMRRNIQIDPEGIGFSIVESAERIAANPFPITLWTVTQLPVPEGLWLESMPVLEGRRYTLLGNRRYLNEASIVAHEGTVAIDFSTVIPGLKIGTFGRQLFAQYDAGLMVITGPYVDGGSYPEGASIETYVGEDFVELETFSTSTHLQPGETLELVTRWRFAPGEFSSPDAAGLLAPYESDGGQTYRDF